MRDWPGFNAVALLEKIIPPQDPDAGPMPFGFAYFLTKDLRDMTIVQRVVRAARYMSAPNVQKYPETWLNILHAFLVLYTDCKHPRSSHGQSRRLDAIKRNIKELNLDGFDEVPVGDKRLER